MIIIPGTRSTAYFLSEELKVVLNEGNFLLKINELQNLDLQRLHLHCLIVEYIKVMPAMLFRISEISIYAY